MLHINPELLVDEPIEQNPDTLLPVQQHVDTLDTYIAELSEKGELSSESTAFARMFARRHDAGYGTDIASMQTDYAVDVLRKPLNAVGAQVSPRYVADYLQRHKDNYRVARIIGHGVLGVVENTRYFEQERHLSRQRALGLASILSAHHSGFPITMVSGFLPEDAALPLEARSAFFIDEGGENPEVIRRKLAEFGASELGISFEDALRAAVLGYSLDRLSPGIVPSELQLRPDGTIELYGGEVVQKKYGLVAGDLKRRKHSVAFVAELYETVLQRIKTETGAAMAAADAANAADIRQFVEGQEAVIRTATQDAQHEATMAMNSLGLMGSFSDLHAEREKLHNYAQCLDVPGILYALATYDAISSEDN
jgi:hypothetical protein